jgi:hypothetical protein
MAGDEEVATQDEHPRPGAWEIDEGRDGHVGPIEDLVLAHP